MSAANQHSDLPTLVFDLDGTLADTAIDLIGTLNVLMKRMGAPEVPVDRARDVVGAGARAMIQRGLALGGRTVSDSDIETLFQEFLVHYAENIAVKTELYPGVRAVLDRLALAGYRLAVCTNKPEEHSIRLLAALGVADRFGSICGRDTFAYAKPDPRHLTLTVEKAGGDPGHAIMIGDSRTDVDTARAAGLPVIAVSFGYTDTPVEKLGPDRIVDHFDELESAILAFRRPMPVAG
jgi:phosphoglycolate phosphatase